jgi:enamine deaminase RidA (YjgF/YER057c/UK114 family)
VLEAIFKALGVPWRRAAARDGGGVMDSKTAFAPEAPGAVPGAPYSQAIQRGGFVFVSGQLALRPDHAEIVGDSIQEQTEQVFANLRAILEEAGSGSTGS